MKEKPKKLNVFKSHERIEFLFNGKRPDSTLVTLEESISSLSEYIDKMSMQINKDLYICDFSSEYDNSDFHICSVEPESDRAYNFRIKQERLKEIDYKIKELQKEKRDLE